MSSLSGREHMNESFRPSEKLDKSTRPAGKPTATTPQPVPIDIGGPSIVNVPKPKPSEQRDR